MKQQKYNKERVYNKDKYGNYLNIMEENFNFLSQSREEKRK